MIRVNLLPAYVAQRRLTRRLVVVFSLAFIVIVASLLSVRFIILDPQYENQKKLADAAVQTKKENDDKKALAVSTKDGVAPIQTKLNFIKDTHAYTLKWVKLYHTLAKYTDLKIIYSSATVSGTTMSIRAYSPSIAEIGRYLEQIYDDPDFQFVSIDRLPGYPEALVNKYYLDNKLVGIQAVSSLGKGGQGMPSFGGGGGGRGFGGGAPGGPPPGFGGPPPGFGGGPSGGFGGPGGPGGGGDLNNATASGERIYTMAEVLKDQINPLATPDGRQRMMDAARKRIKVKVEPQGFNVTITATLKEKLSAPVPPDSGGAAGGAGGPGAFGPSGFGPGGPGGMPPGMGGPPPGYGGR